MSKIDLIKYIYKRNFPKKIDLFHIKGNKFKIKYLYFNQLLISK